jgi:hypothetical protein
MVTSHGNIYILSCLYLIYYLLLAISTWLIQVAHLLTDKDREIERLKQERVELQVKMPKAENGMMIIILSTDLLVKMFSEPRIVKGVRELKYSYLKAEDGIMTGYETGITRSSNNKDNATIHFNQ